MKMIYTVILNYNNYNDSKECIDSLLKIETLSEYKNTIILVDNHSTDGSGQRLSTLFGDGIVYLECNNNSGYAVGNNIGIKYAYDKCADYICVMNNDTVAYEDFLTPCIKYLNNNIDVAFISPTIENYGNEKVQSTGGDIIFEKGLVTVKNNGEKRVSLPRVIESDYIGGACMIFKTNIIDKIGLIPENYFLFFEETEWCWKAKNNGMHNVCLSETYIKHKGSASIDTISGLHAYLMERNRVVFLKRNAPSRIIYVRALIYLTLKYIKKGMFEDKYYFNYLKYMRDGRSNIINPKYPFIKIRN